MDATAQQDTVMEGRRAYQRIEMENYVDAAL
jgi:hypothetical protein